MFKRTIVSTLVAALALVAVDADARTPARPGSRTIAYRPAFDPTKVVRETIDDARQIKLTVRQAPVREVVDSLTRRLTSDRPPLVIPQAALADVAKAPKLGGASSVGIVDGASVTVPMTGGPRHFALRLPLVAPPGRSLRSLETTMADATPHLAALATRFRALGEIRWRDHAWYVEADGQDILFWYDDAIGTRRLRSRTTMYAESRLRARR